MNVTVEQPELEGHDYFDFGCSSGAQLEFNGKVFPGARGLGIDIDDAKLRIARDAGHQAINFDILRLPEAKLVKFVTLSHFLEHLGSVAESRKMLAKAISVARDFVFVRQPWFDSDGELLRLGYKLYWSHWSGHRNKMTSLDFHSILGAELKAGRIRRFVILGRGPIVHGRNSCLIPLEAPINQHKYDPALHGPKVELPLAHQAFAEIMARVDIGDGADAVEAILTRLGASEVIFDSAAANS